VNIAEFGENWANKSPVLVTGHTGFKGTWLTLLLKELGLNVAGYSLEPKSDSMYHRLGLTGEIPEVFADIRDEKLLGNFLREIQPSAIIHLAAQPLVIESYRDPKETFDINVMGTANLIQLASKGFNLEVILVSTTDKVYKNTNSGRRFVETDALEGVDPYSASKVATEAVIRSWQNILDGKIRLISGRAGNVIGGGDISPDRIIPDCVRAHASKAPLTVRNPQSVRPWQHVLEPLSGYLLALGFGQELSYNFGPVENQDLRVIDVIEILKEKLNFEYQIVNETNTLYEAELLSLDSTFAKEKLCWQPTYSQEDAIGLTSDWWNAAFQSRNLVDFTREQIRDFIALQVADV
jgi:CDP-glucose 4,6-dehydratase